MNRRLFLLFLGILFTQASVASIPPPLPAPEPPSGDCSALLAEPPEPPPLAPGRYLLRQHRNEAGFVQEHLHVTETEHGNGLVRRVYQRKMTLTRQASDAPMGSRWHFEHVAPMLRFAIGEYRRRGWTQEFVEKLWRWSWNYLNDTVYMEVLWGPERQRIATMRYVMAPFGVKDGVRVPHGDSVRSLYAQDAGFREAEEKQPDDELPKPPRQLPVAAYLGVDFPLRHWENKGVEFEAGANAIRKGIPLRVHAAAQQLQWLQYWEVLNEQVDETVAIYGHTFYTYGDEKSEMLNLPLGYLHVREYFRDGEFVCVRDEDEPPVFRKDDTDWYAFVQFPEAAATVAENIARSRHRNHSDGRTFENGLQRDPFVSYQGFRHLPVMDRIIEDLGHEDLRRRRNAHLAVADYFALLMLHREVARDSLGYAERAVRALANFNQEKDIARRLHDRLVQIVREGSKEQRDDVLYGFWFLRTKHDLLEEFFGSYGTLDRILLPLASDEDAEVSHHALGTMSDFYHWLRVLYFFGGFWTEFDDVSALTAIEEAAVRTLRQAGWSEQVIENAGKLPITQIPDFATHERVRGQPEVVRALFLLAALHDMKLHFAERGQDWRNVFPNPLSFYELLQ